MAPPSIKRALQTGGGNYSKASKETQESKAGRKKNAQTTMNDSLNNLSKTRNKFLNQSMTTGQVEDTADTSQIMNTIDMVAVPQSKAAKYQ